MVYVKKLDGRTEKYNPSKLRKSLLNSGADKETINKIIAKVNTILHEGIETKELFKFAFKEFKRYKPLASSRYNLKNAILRLDFNGAHFEKLVAEIFQKKGYSVKLNQLVKGKYIKHEIDISAEIGKENIMVECKHHAKPWLGTDIQTALYVYSRFIDVKKWFTVPMLITNTKFSPQVLTYSKGVGLKLMGWKFPKENSLEYNIEKFKIYPVTMLSTLDRRKISDLLRMNILLVDRLASMSVNKLSGVLAISKSRAYRILEEAKILCEP